MGPSPQRIIPNDLLTPHYLSTKASAREETSTYKQEMQTSDQITKKFNQLTHPPQKRNPFHSGLNLMWIFTAPRTRTVLTVPRSWPFLCCRSLAKKKSTHMKTFKKYCRYIILKFTGNPYPNMILYWYITHTLNWLHIFISWYVITVSQQGLNISSIKVRGWREIGELC